MNLEANWLWLFNGIVGMLMALVGALLIHTMNRINAALDRLFVRLDWHETRISRVEGALGIKSYSATVEGEIRP